MTYFYCSFDYLVHGGKWEKQFLREPILEILRLFSRICSIKMFSPLFTIDEIGKNENKIHQDSDENYVGFY